MLKRLSSLDEKGQDEKNHTEEDASLRLSGVGSPLQGVKQGRFSAVLRAFTESQISNQHLNPLHVKKLRDQAVTEKRSGVCLPMIVMAAQSIMRVAENNNATENYPYTATQAILSISPNLAKVVGKYSSTAWKKAFTGNDKEDLFFLFNDTDEEKLAFAEFMKLDIKLLSSLHDYLSEITTFIESYYDKERIHRSFFINLINSGKTNLEFHLCGTTLLTGTEVNLANIISTIPANHFCYVGCNKHAILIWRDDHGNFYVDDPNNPEKHKPLNTAEAAKKVHDGFSKKKSPDNSIANFVVFSNDALMDRTPWSFDSSTFWKQYFATDITKLADKKLIHSGALTACFYQDIHSLEFFIAQYKVTNEKPDVNFLIELATRMKNPTIIIPLINAVDKDNQFYFKFKVANLAPLIKLCFETKNTKLLLELLTGPRKNEVLPLIKLPELTKAIVAERNDALKNLNEAGLIFSFAVMKVIKPDYYEKFMRTTLRTCILNKDYNGLLLMKACVTANNIEVTNKGAILHLINSAQTLLDENAIKEMEAASAPPALAAGTPIAPAPTPIPAPAPAATSAPAPAPAPTSDPASAISVTQVKTTLFGASAAPQKPPSSDPMQPIVHSPAKPPSASNTG